MGPAHFVGVILASTCEYLCGLGLAAWFGGVGRRHGVAMIFLSHGWIVQTPLVLMAI